MNENECGLFTDLSSIIKHAVLDLSGTAAGNLPFVVSTMPFLGLLRQYIFFIFICYNSVIKTKAGMEQHSCEHSLVLYVLGRRHFP